MQAAGVQNWGFTYATATPWYVRLLPSLTDFAFLLPAFLLFVMLPGAETLLGDGDTGWHLRTGDWIQQHGVVPRADIFSFTKSGRPWFAWEWGWDVLFACIHRTWGLAGVVFLNVVLLCLISALLYRLVRRASDNDILAFAVTIVCVCGTMIHWLARPHLFSWFFVLVFAHLLETAERGNRAVLYWLPALMIVWTNVHGAFFVGVLMILASAVSEVIDAGLIRNSSLKVAFENSRPYLLCAFACAIATLVNPYTWHLHEHVCRYLLDSRLLDNIQEYQSINFHHGPVIFFELVLLLGVASIPWCLKTRKYSAAILTLLWAHLALVSGRNAPLFLLIAAPWTACLLNDALVALKAMPCFSRVGASVSDAWNEFKPLERMGRLHSVSAAVILVLAASFASGQPGFVSKFDSRKFPVEAVPVVEASKASRIFTYDQWADYFIYRLYPAVRVFMDGRSDFFGASFIAEYQHIINARYDWKSELNCFAADMVVMKPDAPIATVLKQSPDWNMLLDDGRVIVFRAVSKRGNGGHMTGACDFHPFERTEETSLRASAGFEADSSSSKLKTQERRSLWLLRL